MLIFFVPIIGGFDLFLWFDFFPLFAWFWFNVDLFCSHYSWPFTQTSYQDFSPQCRFSRVRSPESSHSSVSNVWISQCFLFVLFSVIFLDSLVILFSHSAVLVLQSEVSGTITVTASSVNVLRFHFHWNALSTFTFIKFLTQTFHHSCVSSPGVRSTDCKQRSQWIFCNFTFTSWVCVFTFTFTFLFVFPLALSHPFFVYPPSLSHSGFVFPCHKWWNINVWIYSFVFSFKAI